MKKRLISMALAVSMAVSVMPTPVLATDIGGGGKSSSEPDPVAVQASDATLTTYASTRNPFTDDQGVEYIITGGDEVEVSGHTNSLSGDLTIRGTVECNGQTYKVTSIGDYAFDACSNLTSVTIGNNVTSIGENVFQSCDGLSSVTLNDGLTSIGDNAFCYCVKLSEITIPATVKSIGSDAFSGCSELKSVTLDEKSTASAPTELSIGSHAFEDCKQLQSADILGYATSIDNYAFQGCVRLESITIGRDQNNGNASISIGRSAFADCSNLSSVTLKDGVTSIGNLAFSDCSKISEITIPKTVTSIGWGAFSGCGLSLGISVAADNTHFFVDEGVLYQNTTGGKKILHSCPSSKTGSFTIPNEIADDVTSIWGRAFYGCSGLTSVTIPNSVTAIGTNAFSNCNSLNAIYFTGTSAKWRSFKQDNPTDSKVHYVRTLALNNSAGVVVKMGDTVVNGAAEVIVPATEITDGKAVTLTVENPETETYAYKWVVTGADSTVSANSASCTLNVKDEDVTVSLTRIRKLTVGDLTITFPDGEYDGTEKEVTVTDKSGNAISCEITYTKEGETGGSTAAPKDAGTYKVTITIKGGEHNGEVIEAGSFTIAPATYNLTVKNAEVTVKDADGKAVEIAKAEDGMLTAKVPENAEVMVKYTAPTDAIVFDLWRITSEATLDVNTKENPLTFTMPAKAVTIEAMTRDATIEDDGPDILGTAAMIGVGVAGTAILGYQGYMIGTELYLNTVLPDGAAIPQNYGELAKLLWTEAGMPAPAAVMAADATDEQKALAWAVEHQLIPADKAADASVTRWEVIRAWNQTKA